MTTFYMDPQDGNDSNNGLSFANRRRLSLPSVSAGDEVRFIAAPDPVDLGSASWVADATSVTLDTPRTKLLIGDVFTGSIDAATDVFTSTNHQLIDGDPIFVFERDAGSGYSLNTLYYVRDATTNTFKVATTVGGAAVNVTASTALFRASTCFTGATNIGAGVAGNYTRHLTGNPAFTPVAAFTTGKMAHTRFRTGPHNLSAYTHITFWFNTSLVFNDIGNFTVTLCSDAAGNTVVDTLVPVDAGSGTVGANSWWPCLFVKSGGGNLGSSIASLAIHTAGDPGIATMRWSNFNACTTDLNLQTLIGKGEGDNFPFYPIHYINNTEIGLHALSPSQQAHSTNVAKYTGYKGETGTANAYSYAPLRIPPGNTPTTNTASIYSPAGGSLGNPVTYSGGWNRTDMSTQTGRTYFTVHRQRGYIFYPNLNDHIRLEKMDMWGGYVAINTGSAGYGIEVSDCRTYNAGLTGMSITVNNQANGTSQPATTVNNCVAMLAETNGIVYGGASNIYPGGTLSDLRAWGCGTGLYILSDHTSVQNSEAHGCTTEGLKINYCRENSVFRNIVVTQCLTGIDISDSSHNSFYDCTIKGCTEAVQFQDAPANRFYNLTTRDNTDLVYTLAGVVTVNTFININSNETPSIKVSSDYLDPRYVIYGRNGSTTDHCILTDGAKSVSDTTTKRVAPFSWKMSITSATRNANYPFRHKVRGILAPSGIPVTVGVWLRRDSSAISIRLVVPGGQLPGMSSSDLVSSTVTSVNGWEYMEHTFTTTMTGYVDAEIHCWDTTGGTTNSGWWEGFSITCPAPVDGSSGLYVAADNGTLATFGLLPNNWAAEGGIEMWNPNLRSSS